MKQGKEEGMKKSREKIEKKMLFIGAFLLAVFVLWTVAVAFLDVRPIGPLGSEVGFAAMNGFVHALTGVRFTLYVITDLLGLIPIFVALSFAGWGLLQWIRRKRLLCVDRGILALGVFYIAVIAVYLFFEAVVINSRPVLIEGRLEASYPSSTTVLAACVIPAALQLCPRIKSARFRRFVWFSSVFFVAFMVILRFLSGVHWASDIIGGLLLSAGLVAIYSAFCK